MATKKYYEMLDTTHPEYVKELVSLINWSQNCESPTPLHLYLDIVGWSYENLGERLCQNKLPNLGYLEIGFLASALEEYTNRPSDVMAWFEELGEAEFGEEEEEEE